MRKRLLAYLLALCMVLGMLPMTVFAEEPQTSAPTKEQLTITGMEENIKYDGAKHTVAAKLNGESLTVKYTPAGGVETEDAPINAGTYTVTAYYPAKAETAEGAGDGYNAGSIVLGDLTIGKASVEVVVTPSDLTIDFGRGQKDGRLGVESADVNSPLDSSIKFSYASGDETIATVAENGIVTGLQVGKTDITVTAQENANYAVTFEGNKNAFPVPVNVVKRAPVTITLQNITMTVGDTNVDPQATAVYTDKDGQQRNPTIKYFAFNKNNSDPEALPVAAVGQNGTLTAVSVGECTLQAVVEPTDDYGGAFVEVKLTVKPKNIADCTIDEIPSQTYSFYMIAAPGVTVKNGQTRLELDKDYTLKYANNTAAGKASVTITGKGNYTGSITKEFEITKAEAVELGITSTLGPKATTVDLSKVARLPSDAAFTQGAVTLGENSKFKSATISGKTLNVVYDEAITEGDQEYFDIPFTSANYKDGCKVMVTVRYTEKAIPTIDKTTVALKIAGEGVPVSDSEKTATVTVKTNGNLSIADNSGDRNIAVFAIDNGKHTVTFTAKSAGTTVFTIESAETSSAEEGAAEYGRGNFDVTVTVTTATSSGGNTGGSTSGGGSSSGGAANTPTTSGGTTSVGVTPSVSSGTATATVTSSTAQAMVSDAVKNSSDNVTVKVNVPSGTTADSVTAQIPAASVSDLASKTSASLTVDTPVADVVIPNSSLSALGASSGNVTVSAAKAADETITVKVEKGGQAVGALPGGMDVSVPVSGQQAQAGSGLVAVLVNADGTQTILPKSVQSGGEMKVRLDSGSATVKFVDNSKSFSDVASHWASGAVSFVSSRELFQGTDPGMFSPEVPMNRAMLVTVLHRLEREPSANLYSFGDVPSDSYYAEATAWAVSMGITNGEDGVFNGGGEISREQLAAMLYRYAQKTDSGKGTMGSYAGMGGADMVSSWASDAMRWAVGSGIITGDNGNLNPGASATRAEVATMLERFVNLIIK